MMTSSGNDNNIMVIMATPWNGNSAPVLTSICSSVQPILLCQGGFIGRNTFATRPANTLFGQNAFETRQMYFQSIQIQCKYCPPTLDSSEIAGVFGFQRQPYTGDKTSDRPGRLMNSRQVIRVTREDMIHELTS